MERGFRRCGWYGAWGGQTGGARWRPPQVTPSLFVNHKHTDSLLEHSLYAARPGRAAGELRALFYPFSLSRPLSSRRGGPPASHRVLHPPHPGLHPGQRRARRGQPPAQVGGRVGQGGQDGGGRGRRGGGLVRGGQFWSGERESGRGWGATRMPLSLSLAPPSSLSLTRQQGVHSRQRRRLAGLDAGQGGVQAGDGQGERGGGLHRGGREREGKKPGSGPPPTPSLFVLYFCSSSSTLTHHPR